MIFIKIGKLFTGSSLAKLKNHGILQDLHKILGINRG